MADQVCPLRRDQLVSQFCEVIPSTLPALDTVLEKTMAAVKNMACAPEEEKLGHVELALHEALANAGSTASGTWAWYLARAGWTQTGARAHFGWQSTG